MKKKTKPTRATKATQASKTPRTAPKKSQLDWFFLGGLLFSAWAVSNTYLGIARYGASQGVYWWFCNLALVGTAGGLLARHRGWLLGFLSIACFTQVFWIIDNLSRLFLGTNALGLVEFMYRPGLALDEFLLAHYHYFTIPVSLLALYFLPKQKSNALWLVAIFNPLIFGVSYFVFPPGQNINCIHAPCMPGMAHLAGPVYSFTFWAVVFAAHLLFAYGFENLFSRLERNKTRERVWVRAFAGVTVAALALTVWDTRYKMSLPSLACSAPSESEYTRIGCAFTLDHSPGNMSFHYKVRNKTEQGLVCRTIAKTQFNEFILHQGLKLAPFENRHIGQVLPYPDVSVNVVLSAVCEPTGERAPASWTPKKVEPVRLQEAR